MIEKFTELQESKENRPPTYDSFGDVDEALAWIYGRLSTIHTPEGVKEWWNNPQPRLEGLIPNTVWAVNPDAVIQAAC